MIVATHFRFCEGGELFDRIAEDQLFSEKDTAIIVRQLLQAIKYCHSRGVVHRDIKPENILMTRKTNDLRVKIIDFGNACTFSPG